MDPQQGQGGEKAQYMASAIVSASTGVISTMLPKLSALIEGDYKLQNDIKSKISFLKDELSSMQTLLVKLSDDEERLDEQDKDWRNKVRELSYDIEDCIDLFMHKMSKDDAEANLFKKTISRIKKIWSRHKMANIIEELKARVEEEGHRRKRYKFDKPGNQVVQIDPRLVSLFVEAKRLVGIDCPREEIVEWLNTDEFDQQLKVVSIVGFGGLGKTTLANQVYQKIKGQFECSCFVPISRNPNVAKILADMLKELGSCVDPSDDERQLISSLRAFLQDKSTPAWELVMCALPENNLNSRIITTTRIASVAESCCSSLTGYVYKIQALSDQHSQNLFFKRVFGDTSACPPHLEKMSYRILEKCHGCPLAIVTIASLLVGKSSKDQWERVCNSVSSSFSHQGMRDILLLSYYDLPHHLKTCLLYLIMFPEDSTIDREELIWRWIAEGFIAEVRGQTVDQVAESYFSELINRSLIQPIDIQYDGRAEACRVHDMVLELIVSLSAEENFASIVEDQRYNGVGRKIRRLSVQSGHVRDEVKQEIMKKWSQVRSISFHKSQEQGTPHLHELHSLRVLVCSGLWQPVTCIGTFFQLTYLAIRCYDITELPEDIGDLQHLQTLDIGGSGIKKLPPSIGRLQKLVRLLVTTHVELPNEIGNLQALQELSNTGYFSINLVETLRCLTKLKTLGIDLPTREKLGHDTGRYEKAFKSSLAMLGKHGLQSLCINYNRWFLTEELMGILCGSVPCLRKLAVNGEFITRLPNRMTSLAYLAHLCLVIERIEQEELCILGDMPVLLFSELHILNAPDERLTISSQQFQCLKEFRYSYDFFGSGGGLEMLFLEEAMPGLRRLCLKFKAHEAESKMGFEFSFEHLASLEHILVRIDPRGATRSRVEAAEAAVRNAATIHPGRPTLELKVLYPSVTKDKDATCCFSRQNNVEVHL